MKVINAIAALKATSVALGPIPTDALIDICDLIIKQIKEESLEDKIINILKDHIKMDEKGEPLDIMEQPKAIQCLVAAIAPDDQCIIQMEPFVKH